MMHFLQNHTYLPDIFKSNFLCFIVSNFPSPRDQKAVHRHTMQCWHSGVSIIAIERILWRLDDLKVLTISKYTMQSTVSSQPPRQICTHFRLFCSPPPRESRVSGYSWRSQLLHNRRLCQRWPYDSGCAGMYGQLLHNRRLCQRWPNESGCAGMYGQLLIMKWTHVSLDPWDKPVVKWEWDMQMVLAK